MNQQILERQASALDRVKAELSHVAHAIDSSDVSELIQELEKQLAAQQAATMAKEEASRVAAGFFLCRKSPRRTAG